MKLFEKSRFSSGHLLGRKAGLLAEAVILIVVLLISAHSCRLHHFPFETEGCNIRTYIDVGFDNYLSQQNRTKKILRMAVVPFDVPETFAPVGRENINYGIELAKRFQQQLLGKTPGLIVELFDRERWPGKREDFLKGNYQAIELARNAAYDLVAVGYMEEITNSSDLVILTKIIDVTNSVTLWDARTVVYTTQRTLRSNLSRVGAVEDQPDLFAFPERTQKFAQCTVERLLSTEIEE